MASLLGSQRATGSPNQQLQTAELLVRLVRQDVQLLLSQAQSSGAGTVTVSEIRIRTWQAALQLAVQLVEQIPVILIYPPPPFAQFANLAVGQINTALAILTEIPIVTQPIQPPQPGQATISVQTLESLLATLAQAEALLRLAIQYA